MKRSNNVILLMLGAGLGVAALSDEKYTEQLRQDNYASKAECVHDWGSEQNCNQDSSQSSSSHSGGGGSGGGGGGGGSDESKRYKGPRYYWDRTEGHPVAVNDSGTHQAMPSAHPGGDPMSHSIGTTHVGTVSRGGFGHFGSFGRGG